MRRSRRGSAEWPSSSTLTKADPPQVQQPKVQQEFPDWLMCGGDEEAVTGFANLLEFARINAAYEVLADPRRRRQYDDFGAKLQPGVGDGFAAMVQCMEPLVIGVGLGVITGVMYASELSMLRTVMYAISGFGLTAGGYCVLRMWLRDSHGPEAKSPPAPRLHGSTAPRLHGSTAPQDATRCESRTKRWRG